MPRLVHPQLETARQIALRPLQLIDRDGFIAESRELDEDRLERVVERVGVDTGGDLEGAGVGVIDEPRRDVVRQTELLADRLEEAAAHPVAEDRVEQRKRPGVRVVAAERRKTDDELR